MDQEQPTQGEQIFATFMKQERQKWWIDFVLIFLLWALLHGLFDYFVTWRRVAEIESRVEALERR